MIKQSSWLLKPLKDIATIVSGSTPRTNAPDYWDGDIPWATPKDLGKLNSIYIENTEKQITKAGYDSCSAIMMPTGSVLFSSRAPIGHIAIAKTPICTNQGFKSFVPNPNIDSLYLFFCLKKFNSHIQSLGRGATFTEISKELIGGVKVPVPPLPLQKKIAAILEKADQARRKRQETLCLTDQFLQAAFLEMFGDPAKNPKGWIVTTFGKAITNIRYGTGSPPPYQDKGIPFIMATNIKNGTVQDNNIRYISPEASREIAKCQMKAGNLIIVRSGVNAGDCGLIPSQYDGAFAAYDLIVELPHPNAVYYNHLINSPFGKTQLAPLKRRAGQPHLNAEQICSLRFPSPPETEKIKFVRLVEKVEAFREKQHQSEQELDTLFQSLMQRAFKGQLAA